MVIHAITNVQYLFHSNTKIFDQFIDSFMSISFIISFIMAFSFRFEACLSETDKKYVYCPLKSGQMYPEMWS